MQAQELPSGSRRWCSPLQCHLFDLLLHVFRIAPLQHCQTQDGAVDIVFIQSIPFSLKKKMLFPLPTMQLQSELRVCHVSSS